MALLLGLNGENAEMKNALGAIDSHSEPLLMVINHQGLVYHDLAK